MTSENITKVSGAILTSFINLFYLEEINKLGIVRHTAKKNLKRTLEDLKEIERVYFNETDKLDDKQLADKLIANKMVFIDWMLKEFDFNDFSKFQEIAYAYSLKPKRLTGITDKILLENGSKKV